jgi:molybdate transport system ATP-binding protein
MTLTLDARVAARGADLSITVEAGETVAVLGSNGAGKSTMLGLLAGLIRADDGSAVLDGVTLFGPGIWVPPHRRGVSLLAQEALLFPHLSVLENVAFGPRSAGVPRQAARTTAERWLREVDAMEFAARKPGQLSGGQAQRIAVARALATDPQLLLLDEPMSALDVTVVPAIRGMLRRVLADRTAIIVTHDVVDAFTLADRVLVMDGGRIVDSGPTRQVLEHPRTAFAAALVGLNLLDDGSLVAPASILVSTERPVAGRMMEGAVESIETRGDLVRVRIGELAADVTPAQFAALGLIPGDHAWLSF